MLIGESHLAYWTNVSFDTRMSGKMVKVLRPYGVTFSTGFATISRKILVLISDVLDEPTSVTERTRAQRAGETLDCMFGSNLFHCLDNRPVRKPRSAGGSRTNFANFRPFANKSSWEAAEGSARGNLAKTQK